MTSYTITIINQSGFSKSYVLYLEPPVVAGPGGGMPIYSNAWMTFSVIVNGAFASATFVPDVYACWSPGEPNPGTVINVSGAVQVDIAQRDSVTFTADPPGLSKPTPELAHPGAFQIVSQPDFTAADDYVFGYALPGEDGLPITAGSFMAEPNETFNITPVFKFYVDSGEYIPGQVVVPPETPGQVAVIDFTGLPQTTATAIQGANGLWTVEYT